MTTTKLEIITPAKAREILDTCNSSNRRMRMWWCHALADAIRRGDFQTTHQGLAFDENGMLLDGQHRLMAIVLSGISVQMLCTYGLSAEAFKSIDSGIKRNTSDQTGLSKKTAEACRLAASIAFPGAVMAHQVLRVADAGLALVHEDLMQACPTTIAVTSSAPVRLAACLLVMDGFDGGRVFSTYKNMVCLNYAELPPVALAFLRQKEQKKINAVKSGDALARAMKALNPLEAGLTKIQVDESGVTACLQRARHILRRSLGEKE